MKKSIFAGVFAIGSMLANASGHVDMDTLVPVQLSKDINVTIPATIAQDTAVIFQMKQYLEGAYGAEAKNWKYAVDAKAETVDIYVLPEHKWITISFSAFSK